MASLVEVSTARRDGEHFRLDVQEGWKQGRGAYGGLAIGALVRAIEHRVADPARKVRSVTAQLPAPVLTGDAAITVDILRSGNSLTCARAALVQAGETRAHAVAVLAATRPAAGSLAWCELTPPSAPPWKQVAVAAIGNGVGPEFFQNFEVRIVDGIPLSGGAPRTVGWVRPKVPCALRDAGYIAALMDVWWPGVLVTITQMRPFATVAYTLELFAGLEGLDPEAPLLYRGAVPVVQDGYLVETRELWGEDGRLVAINHQTLAVIA